MSTLKLLLARNRSWSHQKKQNDPRYFERFINNQSPHTLWIGCSDSRVPSETIVQASPGELFVHRNIANIVEKNDFNTMSAIQYAIQHLKVSSIVICGHYGCGGITYATNHALKDLESCNAGGTDYIHRRLTPTITTLKHNLMKYPYMSNLSPEQLHRKLVELNIMTQIEQLAHTPLMKDFDLQIPELTLYGCVYDLQSGHIKLLRTLPVRKGIYYD